MKDDKGIENSRIKKLQNKIEEYQSLLELEDEEEERKQLEKMINKAKYECEKSHHSEIESDAKKINEEMIQAMDGIRKENKKNTN